VDDEPGIRATLPLIMRKHGFDVTVTSSVREAEEQINSQRFDALLTDLNIEQAGDGFALVRAVRKVNPSCATIVLTGYPDVPSAVEGIRERVDDYLVKPANIDVLVASLRTHISNRKPKARILSVSFDEPLLRTRHMLLEREGYDVVSALGLVASLKECQSGGFDLFILGHSIDYSDKKELVDSFRRTCPAPIISLRLTGEKPVEGADYHIDPDPKNILETVAEVVRNQT
jgi:DNA-binding response OmpR family regulator